MPLSRLSHKTVALYLCSIDYFLVASLDMGTGLLRGGLPSSLRCTSSGEALNSLLSVSSGLGTAA